MNRTQRMLNRLTFSRMVDNAQPKRVSGGSTCYRCQKDYYSHPKGGPATISGEQYLNKLCDERLVKL